MPNLLTRDAILTARDLPTEDVGVPEWGGTVRVRGLTAKERDEYEAATVDFRNPKKPTVNLRNTRARLVALCAIDEEGRRLFTREDVDALGDVSSTALDRVFQAAKRLSGIDSDGEAAAKNLPAIPGDGSPTA